MKIQGSLCKDDNELQSSLCLSEQGATSARTDAPLITKRQQPKPHWLFRLLSERELLDSSCADEPSISQDIEPLLLPHLWPLATFAGCQGNLNIKEAGAISKSERKADSGKTAPGDPEDGQAAQAMKSKDILHCLEARAGQG